MKHIQVFTILFFISFGLLAQNKEAMKKIESARIALISERLGLSPEQAEKFWPVYREYNMERRALRETFRAERKEAEARNLTDEESQQLIKKSMELRQKELNLDKTYSKRLTEVISNQQLVKLKTAERDFQKMLIQRIQEQRKIQDQNQKMMQRREMMKDRNSN